MKTSDLDGRRVAVLGSGREGRAALSHLRRNFPGQPIGLIDENEPDGETAGILEEGDRLHVGPLDEAPLADYEVVLRSPGISVHRPELARAREQGVQIVSPNSVWFADHPQARTICITGTKGKSTTSALLAHILNAAGYHAMLAGNIGRPLLACDDDGVDWWVIELSSFQLADLEADPTIAVFLNLSPEHLDWHGSEAAYVADKLRLLTLARDGLLIANAGDPFLADRLSAWPGELQWFDGKDLDDSSMPPALRGEHNRSNIQAALTAARAAGVTDGEAQRALFGFRGLPHRLQVLGESGGALWVDDSISTTPVSTLAALEAWGDQDVIVLLGGLDRGLDWQACADGFIEAGPAAVIGLPDSGADILDTLRAAGLSPPRGFHTVEDLEQGTMLAARLARPGDVVLLSPGAASFPRFKDYSQRGRVFARCAGFEPQEWSLW